MSNPLCHRRDTCRLCESRDLEQVLSLAPTPPANAFVAEADLGQEQEKFPLDVFFCTGCGHVQLLDVVGPAHLFENYVYVSGTSEVFVKHFQDYANTVTERFVGDGANRLVVDIGSNDGTLLAQFQALGLGVLGIDPARDIAAAASAGGIETKAAFFTSDLAAEIRQTHGPAQVVCANNVFAHADDLKDMIRGITTLLAPGGVFVFEVSYLVDVFEKTLFDTIYHEHVAYHSVGPLVRFFETGGLEMIDAQRVGTHGGSLRGVVQRAGGPHRIAPSVKQQISLESGLKLDCPRTLRRFSEKIDACKRNLTECLFEMKSRGNRIAAFGAPAKATTLMYHFDIGLDIIDFIVDDSPLKQGLYSPGMHIPVLPSQALYENRPDAVVILAWNFADSIIRTHEKFVEQGGRFIVPLPEVRVY